jgi:hypothetical protein
LCDGRERLKRSSDDRIVFLVLNSRDARVVSGMAKVPWIDVSEVEEVVESFAEDFGGFWLRTWPIRVRMESLH